MDPQKKNAPTERNNEGAKKQIFHFDLKYSAFIGTKNMAELRAIDALLQADCSGVSRNDLDLICGSSNSPEIIRRLRAKGLHIDCEIKDTVNRFGEPVRAGFYSLTRQGAAKLRLWLREKAREVQ